MSAHPATHSPRTSGALSRVHSSKNASAVRRSSHDRATFWIVTAARTNVPLTSDDRTCAAAVVALVRVLALPPRLLLPLLPPDEYGYRTPAVVTTDDADDGSAADAAVPASDDGA